MKRHTSARWIRFGVLVGVTALVVVLAGTSFAWNERDDGSRRGNGFSNRSIKGYYGYNSSFSMLVATGPNQPVVPALPFAGMGRIFFDGQGGCTVSSIGEPERPVRPRHIIELRLHRRCGRHRDQRGDIPRDAHRRSDPDRLRDHRRGRRAPRAADQVHRRDVHGPATSVRSSAALDRDVDDDGRVIGDGAPVGGGARALHRRGHRRDVAAGEPVEARGHAAVPGAEEAHRAGA